MASAVGRPKKRETELQYIEFGLSNGARWRIIYRTLEVYEIDEFGGKPNVLGPISLDEFLRQLEEARPK